MAHDRQRQLSEAALDEVLEWEELRRSPQLGKFLRYIVERTLEGDQDSLKAYSIAVDVLGRGPDFDPQVDPIVRVQAARLRNALDRFYESGQNKVPLRIDIPVGRYVPKFSAIELDAAKEIRPEVAKDMPNDGDAEADDIPETVTVTVGRGSAQQWRRGVVPLIAMVGVVLLALALMTWLLVTQRDGGTDVRPDKGGVIEPPVLRIDGFDNLTGMALLDNAVAGFGRQLIVDLSRFELLDVEQEDFSIRGQMGQRKIGGVAYLLTGVVRRSEIEVYIDVLLSRMDDRRVLWTQTLGPVTLGSELPGGLTEQSQKVGAALGSLRGPLHSDARAWMAENPRDYGEVNSYVCQMLFSLTRDGVGPHFREAALSCFEKLREADPGNAIAHAGWAGLRADIVRDTAPLGERLAEQLFDETRAARLAVELDPQSAIAHAELAHVLAVQNLSVEARQSFKTAVQRNPADGDIRGEYALFLAYTGEWDAGQREMDAVLAQAASSPPWYYELHAFNDLLLLDYEAALSDALIIVRGDPELGKVLALAAAPLAARSDVVERYFEDVMTDPLFQEKGILPRLSRRIGDEEVLQLLSPGLQLAGVPIKAINLPFGPEDFVLP